MKLGARLQAKLPHDVKGVCVCVNARTHTHTKPSQNKASAKPQCHITNLSFPRQQLAEPPG